MTVSELLPTLSEWKREDKLRLMKHLVSELAREENALPGDEIYWTWPPTEGFKVEEALLTALNKFREVQLPGKQTAMGKYAHISGSSEEYAQTKQEEIAREERPEN